MLETTVLQSICCICLKCSVLLHIYLFMTATPDCSPFSFVYFSINAEQVTRASKNIKILFLLHDKTIIHILNLKYNVYTATLSCFLVEPSSGRKQLFWKRASAPGKGLLSAAESTVHSRDEAVNSHAGWSDSDLRQKPEWMEI